MRYGPTAVERAMKIQEVILRAMSGELSWLQAADIIGCSPRTMRRWRARYDRTGYDGLLDRRHGRPSPRRVPRAEVERLLRLYRESYLGFNVRHFHEIARREHGLTLSYSCVKRALQDAGLVRKRRAAAGITSAGSRGPASGRCCTWTAARIPGWPWSPISARPCSRSSMMPPSASCMPNWWPARARRR